MRAMLQRFFVPVQAVALVEFSRQGLLTPEIVAQAVAALPLVAGAVVGGTYVNRRIDPAEFSDAVAYIVLGLGALCAYTAWTDFPGTASQGSSLILSVAS